MKSKIKLILLIFIGVYSISFINAKAATSLPADYEIDDFKYTIESFDIKVYKGEGIFSNQVYKTINIPKEKVTINPKGEKINVANMHPMTGVKLNFQLEDDTIENLIKKEIPEPQEEKEVYFAMLEVNYKMTKIPQKYPFMIRFNILNLFAEFGSAVDSDGLEYNVEDAKVSLNQSTSQIIDMSIYGKLDGKVIYETENEGTSLKEIAVEDYLILSKTETIDITDDNTKNTTYGFIIHDFDNIEEVYKRIQDENIDDDWINLNEWTDNEKNYQDTKQIQTIKVPNTDANNRSKILFGISVLLLGSSIILFELRKKYNK